MVFCDGFGACIASPLEVEGMLIICERCYKVAQENLSAPLVSKPPRYRPSARIVGLAIFYLLIIIYSVWALWVTYIHP